MNKVANIQQHNGSMSELRVAVDLMERGFEVFIPMNRHSSVDFVVIDETGRVFKVEVKSSRQSPSIWHDAKFDVLAVANKEGVEYCGTNGFNVPKGRTYWGDD